REILGETRLEETQTTLERHPGGDQDVSLVWSVSPPAWSPPVPVCVCGLCLLQPGLPQDLSLVWSVSPPAWSPPGCLSSVLCVSSSLVSPSISLVWSVCPPAWSPPVSLCLC